MVNIFDIWNYFILQNFIFWNSKELRHDVRILKSEFVGKTFSLKSFVPYDEDIDFFKVKSK